MQDSDDIRYMVGALKALGVQLEEDWPNNRLTVTGCTGKFPNGDVELNLGNAGTAMRPLVAAVAAAGSGEYVLDGVERMRERPIGDLITGLQQLGAFCRIHGLNQTFSAMKDSTVGWVAALRAYLYPTLIVVMGLRSKRWLNNARQHMAACRCMLSFLGITCGTLTAIEHDTAQSGQHRCCVESMLCKTSTSHTVALIAA